MSSESITPCTTTGLPSDNLMSIATALYGMSKSSIFDCASLSKICEHTPSTQEKP